MQSDDASGQQVYRRSSEFSRGGSGQNKLRFTTINEVLGHIKEVGYFLDFIDDNPRRSVGLDARKGVYFLA